MVFVKTVLVKEIGRKLLGFEYFEVRFRYNKMMYADSDELAKDIC